MNTYIVIQTLVEDISINGNDTNVTLQNIVRKVRAYTAESAVGKFVLATQYIKANRKLNIECYDINELKSL